MRDRTPPMGIEMNTHIIRTSMLGLFWKSPNQENRRPARTSRTRISPMQRSLNSRTRAPHRRPSKGGRTSMAKWASFFTPTPIPRNTIQIRMNRTSSSDQRNSGFCSTYRTNTWAETHTVITEINPKVIHLWIPSSRSTRRFMESPRETAARRNLGPRPAAVITWVLLLPLALDRVEDVGDPHLLRDALTHREGDVHHLLFLLEGIELHPELALHLRHCLVVLPPLGGPGYRRSLLRRPQHDLLLRRRELGPGLAAHEEGPHGDDVRCLGDVGTHLGLLRSKLGAGTTVEIYLPRAVEAERSEPPRSRAGGKETVLLVAPDPRARRVTERALRNHGFRLIVAADADEALAAERWHQAPIDLLLTDLVLPRRSGAELASALRRLRPMIRVLFLSGDGAAAAAGPDDAPVLARPFSAGALAARVRETLDAPIDHREAGG